MRHISFVFDILHLISRNYFSFFFLLFCEFKLRVINYIEVNTGECIHMAHYEWQLIFFLWVSFVSGAICCCCSFAFAVCEKRQKETFSVFFCICFFLCKLCKQLTGSWLSWAFFFAVFVCRTEIEIELEMETCVGSGGRGNKQCHKFV